MRNRKMSAIDSGRTRALVVLAAAVLLAASSSGAAAFVPARQQRHRRAPSRPPAPTALRSAVAPGPPAGSSAASGGDGGGSGSGSEEFDDINNNDPEHPPPIPVHERKGETNGKRRRGDDDDERHDQFHHHENDFDVSSYRSIRDFNSDLADLARRCSDENPRKKEDVIGCAALAEGMLHRLEHLVRDADEEGGGDGIMRPDVVSYNTVVNAWSKASATLAEGRGRGTLSTTLDTDMAEVNVYTPTDAASRAASILDEMEGRYLRGESDVAPDTTTYNAAIDAWTKSRCKDAASKAETILARMIHLTTGGEDDDAGSQNGSREKWEQARPDTITYNSVIEAWAHSPQPGGLKRAVSILDMLEKEHDRTGEGRYKPTIRTVNQVINAYAKKGTEAYGGGPAQRHQQQQGGGDERAWAAANKSRRLLEGMKRRYAEAGDPDYRPDAATYTSCCDAYSRVGEAAAAEKAEALLVEMEREYNETGDGRIKPNFRTYTAVIAAWAKTPDRSAPHRAEEILSHMEGLHAESVAKGERVRKEESVKPNSRTYTSVIGAWARSGDPTKPQRALRILKKMQDLHRDGDEGAKPSVFTYNTAIDACAKCRGSGEQQVQALRIAFAINKAISAARGVEPNQLTYINLLKCAQMLMPLGEERNAVSGAVFRQALDAGMVDDSVVRALQRAADRSLFNEFCGSLLDKVGHVQYDSIPHEWSKNVR